LFGWFDNFPRTINKNNYNILLNNIKVIIHHDFKKSTKNSMRSNNDGAMGQNKGKLLILISLMELDHQADSAG